MIWNDVVRQSRTGQTTGKAQQCIVPVAFDTDRAVEFRFVFARWGAPSLMSWVAASPAVS